MNFKIKFYYEEKGIFFLNFWLWWKYGKIDIINVVYIFKIVVLKNSKWDECFKFILKILNWLLIIE